MSIIGIVLGVVAIGLFIWLKKDQQMSNDLHEAELNHTHQGMNALMNDFNNYQVETNRKIAELEKQLEIRSKSQDKKMKKHLTELPSIIGRVVGQIEFAQDIINKK
jgi:ATP-dependent 26S proteasome regulatory subunit